MKNKKKTPVYYMNNKDLYAQMVEYKKSVEAAKQAGKELPRVPEKIGMAIYSIAENFSRDSRFYNYPFREDMVMDAVENCIRYINNFDPEKTQNPFAYFTQISFYAFLRKIDKEKTYLYTKFKNIERVNLFENTTAQQLHDDYSKFVVVDEIKQNESTVDNMNEFVKNFEEKKAEKKQKKEK